MYVCVYVKYISSCYEPYLVSDRAPAFCLLFIHSKNVKRIQDAAARCASSAAVMELRVLFLGDLQVKGSFSGAVG